MIWSFMSFLCRRFSAHFFSILTAIGIAALGTLAWWFWPQWLAGDFDKRAHILEIMFLGSGSLSIIMLASQLRQQAAWNKVLSFHEYFSDVPSLENVTALHATFRRLAIELPDFAHPLSDANADLIIADTAVDPAIGSGRVSRVIVQAYLDDLEEFCAAVNAGIVSDSYAREIEGTRTIRAYFAFESLIAKLREKQQELVKLAQQTGTGARQSRPFQSKYYAELERVARRWRAKREQEHNASQGLLRFLTRIGTLDSHV